MNETIRIAAMLGASTGIRSMSGFGILATSVSARDHLPFADQRLRWIAQAALAGEIVADKALPLPARTEPLPLVGRAAFGGASAATAASWMGGSRLAAATVGAATALATAWAATTLRRAATSRGVPDLVPAWAEDLVVVVLGAAVDRLLTNSRG